MKKIVSLVILLLVVFLCACGTNTESTLPTQSQTVPETTDVLTEMDYITEPTKLSEDEVYMDFLIKLREKLWDIVVDDTHLDGFGEKEGMLGISEIASVHKTEMLNKIGFGIFDINQDGIDELFLFEIDELSKDASNGTRIISAYTIKDGQKVLLFDGTSRNRYYLLDDMHIYNESSASAAESGFGLYHLDENNDFVCDAFYFTAVGNDGGIALMQNQSGVFDASASSVYDGDESAFWEIAQNFAQRIQIINITAIDAVEN